jgi:hypothetical protein
MTPQNNTPNRYGYLRSKRRLWGVFGFLLGIFLVFCLHADTRWIVNKHLSSLNPMRYNRFSATYVQDIKTFPQKGLAERLVALWLLYPEDEQAQYTAAKSILGDAQGEYEGTIYLRWLLSLLNQSHENSVARFKTAFKEKQKLEEGLKVSEEYALRFPKNPYFRLVKMEMLALDTSRPTLLRRVRVLNELDALSRADFSNYRDYSLDDPAFMSAFLERREGRLSAEQRLSILNRYSVTQRSNISPVLELIQWEHEKERMRIDAQLVKIANKMFDHLVSPLQEEEAREILVFAADPKFGVSYADLLVKHGRLEELDALNKHTKRLALERDYYTPYPVVNGMIGWFIENFTLRLILLVALFGGFAGLKVYRNRFTLDANNPPKEKQVLTKVLLVSALILLMLWCMAESLMAVSLAQVSLFDPIFTREYVGQALWMSFGFVAVPLVTWLFVLLAFTLAKDRFTLNALAKRVSRTALPVLSALLVCYLGASLYTARLERVGQSYMQARYAMQDTASYASTFHNYHAPLEYIKNRLRSMTY